MEITKAILLSMGSALLIELSFRLIRSHSGPLRHVHYVPVNYLAVSEAMFRKDLRWSSFILFRIFPPLMITGLLGALLNRYTPTLPLYPFLVLTAVVASAPRSGRMMLSRRSIPAERWVHGALFFSSLTLAILASLFDDNPYLTKFAPGFSGLVDNLWSSLFAALLVVLYIDSTRLTKEPQKETVGQSDAYVAHWFGRIESIHGTLINRLCGGDFLLSATVYSVLIVENYNRPKWLRVVENCVVRIPRVSATVGLGQVRSERPLTDQESVERCVGLLSAAIGRHNAPAPGYPRLPMHAVSEYNADPSYPVFVNEVFECLLRLRPAKFGIAVPV